jgi:hypothetical protein
VRLGTACVTSTTHEFSLRMTHYSLQVQLGPNTAQQLAEVTFKARRNPPGQQQQGVCTVVMLTLHASLILGPNALIADRCSWGPTQRSS